MNTESIASPEKKIQLTCWDILGNVYKQGIYVDRKRAYGAHKRACNKYGAYLRLSLDEVPVTQKKPIYRENIGSQYCFCPGTSLYSSKCSKCGKPPFTD